MLGSNSVVVQQEIQSNMSVVSRQEPACNNMELGFQNNKQAWANSRANRRTNNLNKPDQPKSPRDFVISSNCENNNLNIVSSNDETTSSKTWLENVNQRVMNAYSNNRSCSDNLETMENFRNSQESLKRRNSENIMAIEMNMRASRNNVQTTGHDLMRSRGNSMSSGSLYSMAGGQDDTDPSLRITQAKDPHTAAIDLSNNCRQFYFNHLKTAEAIKQSVRTARHTRAREKMEGKQPSSLDNAMEKLRAEMADLMDQDLSLMSQLLKLNDKIEDIKIQTTQRLQKDTYSSCYLSGTDISDSEMSDYEDSRTDLTKSVNSPHGYFSTARRYSAQPDIPLRRTEPSKGDIIIYRKRPNRKKHKKPRSCSGTDEDTAKEDNEEDDDDEEGETTSDEETDKENSEKEENSDSDTGSTISNKSTVSDTNDSETQADSGVTSDSGSKSSTTNKDPPVPPKPVKGGVSRNTSFLNFHKDSGPVRSANGRNPILTHQGHHINVEKFYVPQGLVYLKHTKSDNVFCQFTS